jgi:CRP-like cAMP-binding protein
VLPLDAIGRVLGLVRSMAVLGMVVAAAVTPLLVAALGLSAAVAVVGLVPAAVSLLLLRRSARIDRDTEVRRARIAPFLALLRGVEAFADSTGAALELLASAGERVEVPADELVIVEGERADWFYVVVDGSLEVTTGPDRHRQRVVGELTAGDGFGEIGLLRRSPRTASVRTTSPAVLHRYPGSAFVAAVEADERAGLTFERGMVSALRSSHPELADHAGGGDDGPGQGDPGARTTDSGDPSDSRGTLHAGRSRRRSRRSRSR